MYVTTIAVPWQVYMIPQFILISKMGLNDTHIGLILMQAFSAFGVFLIRQFYISIPDELCEAARIDGANKWREFLHVTMPSIKGTVILCLLLRTIDSFRMFDKVNVLTQGGPANTTSTITQYIYTYGIKSLDFGFGSAGAVVMAVLVLVLSSVYIQRTFRKV